jgi:hypothetical protein
MLLSSGDGKIIQMREDYPNVARGMVILHE